MTRVQLLDSTTVPLGCRHHFEAGDPGPIVAALAQVPELVDPVTRFVGAALGPGAASTRHKEMAILRTSVLSRCRYCTQAHTAVALDSGLSAEEVEALRGARSVESAFNDDAEHVLLDWIDAMAGSGPVAEDVWIEARAAWPEHILLELSVTIGATLLLNRFATGFELPSATPVVERLAAEGWT